MEFMNSWGGKYTDTLEGAPERSPNRQMYLSTRERLQHKRPEWATERFLKARSESSRAKSFKQMP